MLDASHTDIACSKIPTKKYVLLTFSSWLVDVPFFEGHKSYSYTIEIKRLPTLNPVESLWFSNRQLFFLFN